MLTNKLVIGTVQFGLDYGIRNEFGQVSYKEVTKILNLATQLGINTLDTAQVYGNCEKVIGRYLKHNNARFQLISKIDGDNPALVKKTVIASLKDLNITSIYGCLVHQFADYEQFPLIYDVLRSLKTKKKIKKIGFSLYFPDQLERLLEKETEIDIIQVPFSIFDRRFEPYFKLLHEKQIEIYVRSVFLQGLFFQQVTNLPNYFDSVKNKLSKLQALANSNNIPLEAMCLNFVDFQQLIGKIIVGVHTADQLKNNIQADRYSQQTSKIFDELDQFRESNNRITVPLYWPS
ncbi:MAG: aldo/keto reductase [Candidatus Pacebacteria bacterium CG_4_10_14_0_8_um_filter_43_12]|nr:MAG: aldo/keto reductase [Candidatus Pacebacteria bacterium CG_4_10_14_0_8_um_filter_43_12]